MSITLEQLFTDPRVYFHSFDEDHARFVEMDRDDYARSIFFDRRIQRKSDVIYRIPLVVLLDGVRHAPPPLGAINFIHHVAQCGSTLLSRALDRPDVLAIREPFSLRQLGVEAGAGGSPDLGNWQQLLDLSLRLLAKRFEPGPVMIKGNVPITMIAPAIEQIIPRQFGILLHFPLDDYFAAVLRTPQHAEWVNSVTDELRIGENAMVGEVDGMTVPQRVAALWALMMRRFDRMLKANPNLRSLDANLLFDDPRAAISASSNLFDLGMTDQDVEAQVNGALFSTYSKDPSRPYEPAERVARREETKREYPDAIREARDWIMARKDEFELPEMLGQPLVGAGTPLL